MLESIFSAVVMLLAVWGIWFWSCFLVRPKHSKHARPAFPTPFGLLDVTIIFAGWILAPGMVVGGFLFAWGETELGSLTVSRSNTLIGATAVTQLLVCLFTCWFFVLRYHSMVDVFGWETSKLSTQCKIAAKSFVMVVPGLLGLQWLLSQLVPYEHSTISQLQDSFSMSTLIVTWFAAVIVAPVCEELLFRCVLQGWLQRIRFRSTENHGFSELTGGWDTNPEANRPVESTTPVEFDAANPFAVTVETKAGTVSARRVPAGIAANALQWWMPVVASSFLFAAVHIGQGLAPVSLFVFGMVLGYLYRQTGSIVPSIGLHFLLNAFSMFWVTLETSLSSISDAL